MIPAFPPLDLQQCFCVSHISLALIGKFLGYHAIGHYFLFVINVIEKSIESLHALDKAGLKHFPFLSRNFPGNGIEKVLS